MRGKDAKGATDYRGDYYGWAVMCMIRNVQMREALSTKAIAVKIREFMRMCGIQVNYEEDSQEETDLFFNVCNETGKYCAFSLQKVNEREYEELLGELLNSFVQYNLLQEEEKEKRLLDRLKDIYVRNNLSVHIYNIYHFHRVSTVLEQSLSGLMQAYADLYVEKEKFEKENLQCIYYMIYARAQCGKRINEICNLMNKRRVFLPDVLAGELEKELEKTENKACAYYLIGQLYFVDSQERYKSNLYFEKAKLYGMKDFFESNLNYYMGLNRQNATQRLDEEAVYYYEDALRKNRNCYRAMYKLGIYYVNHKQYREALKQFQMIRQCLHSELECRQPLEIMYLFKAYQRIASTLIELDLETDARMYRKFARQILHSDVPGCIFLKNYYGNNANVYREYMIGCMKELSIFDD